MNLFFKLNLIFWVGLCTEGFSQQHRIDSLLNVLPRIENPKERIDIQAKLALAYATVSVQDAEQYAQEAMQEARELNYKEGLAECFKIFGLIHYVQSEYMLAMEYSYRSLRLYEELGDRRGESRVLNNLALIMLAEEEYGRAYHFAQNSLRLKRQMGDSLGVANSMLAIAQYFRYAGEYNKAREVCQSALAKFKLFNDDVGTSHAFFSLGQIYLSEKKYFQASRYYHDAMQLARATGDQMQIINASKQLGKLFLESQRLDSAYLYLHKTIHLAHKRKNRFSEMEASQHMAELFIKTNQLDSALLYTRNAAAIERDIYTTHKEEQMVTLQKLYDFNNQQQELEFQKKIVRRQYVAIAGVTLILVLSVLFGSRVYALNKSNQKAKEELLKLNNEIKQINENLEGIVFERTEEIKSQNQKLIDYAFFTAHEIRGPLARILGLIELAKIKDLSEDDKKQIMERLENASNELDDIIRKVNRRLESAKR